MKRIALFTIAVGADRHYFDSVCRFFPYNKEYFGKNHSVDYFLFTDRNETIEGIVNILCKASVWPYTALLKTNIISDYLNEGNKWNKYDCIFFIDADFAIGDKYDFFSHNFLLLTPYWTGRILGTFFGGKVEYFKKLCSSFYDEIKFIYENKLQVPYELDESYLAIFREQHKNDTHIIEIKKDTNILFFYDNEDLEEKIRQTGNRTFLLPLKSKGRANRTVITNCDGNELECTVNLNENYIFDNYSYALGRLVKLDNENYRILWCKQPERREVLNIKTQKIRKQPTGPETAQSSPVISIVMPTYNTPPEYMKESVESVLKQTFADFELLIIDDGSTDLSGIEKLKEYNDPRIRLITNNHDFIASLNRGVSEAKGIYIARMDADDVMLPNRLQVQYEFMEEHPEVDVCGSWIELFGLRKGTVQVYTEYKSIVASMLLQNPMAHPSIIMRKSVLKNKEQLYKYDYPYAEDYKLWTDLAMEGFRFANIPQVLLLFRSSENQVSNIKGVEMTGTSRKIQAEYAEWVMAKIVEKEERFFDFFEQIIMLSNEKKIDINQLSNIVYQIYLKSLS